MVYIVETHSEEAAAMLQHMATLKLVTLQPKNGTSTLPANDEPFKQTILAQLLAWANEEGLSDSQKEARHSLVPQLLERKMQNLSKTPKNWSGVIGRETGKKILEHVEQLRNEWEREF